MGLILTKLGDDESEATQIFTLAYICEGGVCGDKEKMSSVRI